MIIINIYPIIRNIDCDFKYLYESLYLYSAQILDDEYIISKPNKLINITDNISILLYFFKINHLNLFYYLYIKKILIFFN